MFTGIIECLGEVSQAEFESGNLRLRIRSSISSELKIDQSVSHNGVCLTVVDQQVDWHEVQVVEESLKRSNLAKLLVGHQVNLERCLEFNGRLDGHLVQGHVDEMIKCLAVKEANGSWWINFEVSKQNAHLLIPKGSVCINGVSLTIAELTEEKFSVAIIPYTYEQTTFKVLQVNDLANVEYDVLGKYVHRNLAHTNR